MATQKKNTPPAKGIPPVMLRQRIKDGWSNVLAGLGRKADKTQHTQYGTASLITEQELTEIWSGEGLAKKIVSVVVADMIRPGWEINGDPDGQITEASKSLRVPQSIGRALNWMRLYGGSLIVMGINDGMALNQPVRVSGGMVGWLKVYPSTRVRVNQTDLSSDPSSPYYEDVEIFPILRADGTEVRVHASRCLVFKGEALPPDSLAPFSTRYWGMSALQAPWDRIRQFGGATQGIANLLLEFNIGKYRLANLEEILSENNVSAIYNRLEVINASKSLINAVLLGKDEEYSRDSANVTGLPDLLDRWMMMVSGETGIPVTRLFGRSSAGMNSTGDGDLTNYYDMVGAERDDKLHDPLTRLILQISRGLGLNPVGISVEFNPVWEPSEAEMIKMRREQAETDRIYMDSGVLAPEEIRESRFVNGYSFNTSVDSTVLPNPPEGE